MIWVRTVSLSAIAPGNSCKLRHRLWCALLLVVLIGPSAALGADPLPEAPLDQAVDLTVETRVGEPFTTAQINTVLRLMDRTKQRFDPEYYLSEDYLHEVSLESATAKQLHSRQVKWRQATLEKQRLRQEMLAEQAVERYRMQAIRAQELNIMRIKRQAQLSRHRRQRCQHFQQRVKWRRQFNNGKNSLVLQQAYPGCS